MTLILGYTHKQIPCMISDLLLSAEVPTTDIPIPASGKESDSLPIKEWTHYPAGLKQKLVVVGPHMMIAFAGLLNKAMEAINLIKKEYDNKDPKNIDQLIEVTKVIGGVNLDDCALICLLVIQNEWRLRTINSFSYDLVNGDKLDVAGDGIDYGLELFNHSFDPDNSNDWNHSLLRLLSAAGRLWFWDLTGSSIENAFGGGYEIAIKQQGSIQKIGDILYSNFVYLPGKGIGGVGIFKKVDYLDDILVLRIIETYSDPSKSTFEIVLKRASMYVILPHQDATKPELSTLLKGLPDLNATYSVIHVCINSSDPNKDPHSSTLVKIPHGRGNGPIQFQYNTDTDSSLPSSLFITNETQLELVETVKSVLEKAGETYI